MEVRRTQEKDIDSVMDIYAKSRKFMKENGNPTQWGNNFPNIELVKYDVERNGYVIVKNGEILGVFVLEENAHEPAYDSNDGIWLNDKPYAVIHRCATGVIHKGIGQFILEWCFNKFNNIRIDTHEDNIPMRNLLDKNGYKYCGKVYYIAKYYGKDYGERFAYQKSKD